MGFGAFKVNVFCPNFPLIKAPQVLRDGKRPVLVENLGAEGAKGREASRFDWKLGR